MDAFVLKTSRVLTPWNDHVASVPVHNLPLHHALPAALSLGGAENVFVDVARGEVGEAGEALVTTDDLWITPELVAAFVRKARSYGKASILAVRRGLFTEFTSPLQHLREVDPGGGACLVYPLVWVPDISRWTPGGDLVEEEQLTPLPIDLEVRPMEIPVHKVFSADEKFLLPLTHLACVRICHWMHILRANQVGLLAWGARLFAVQPHRLVWAAIRAMSVNKFKVMQKLTTRGRGCEIHPSAVIEASTLGDNVEVGAGAVIRFSHLGNGVRISDQANVQYSVLGDGATVARMGMLQSCVLFPGANSGHYGLQLCVVGRDTFVGGEVILGDFRPEGTIKVRHEGELHSTGTRVLGCAVGHDCQIMMRATFYAGREIPNGYRIIGPPRDIVAKIPLGLPPGEPLMAHDGVLEPYSQRRPSTETAPTPPQAATAVSRQPSEDPTAREDPTPVEETTPAEETTAAEPTEIPNEATEPST